MNREPVTQTPNISPEALGIGRRQMSIHQGPSVPRTCGDVSQAPKAHPGCSSLPVTQATARRSCHGIRGGKGKPPSQCVEQRVQTLKRRNDALSDVRRHNCRPARRFAPRRVIRRPAIRGAFGRFGITATIAQPATRRLEDDRRRRPSFRAQQRTFRSTGWPSAPRHRSAVTAGQNTRTERSSFASFRAD